MQLGYKNAFVLAVGAKFRFKFIRRYVANFIQFMRTATQISFRNFTPQSIYCKHSLAKHTVNAATLQNVPAQNTACQTALSRRSRSIGFWRAARALAS